MTAVNQVNSAAAQNARRTPRLRVWGIHPTLDQRDAALPLETLARGQIHPRRKQRGIL